MADPVTVLDSFLIVSGRDLAPQFNTLTHQFTHETRDKTAFGDTTRTRARGLKDFSLSLQGFWANDAASTAAETGGKVNPSVEFDKLWFDRVNDSTQSVFAFGPENTTGLTCFFGPGFVGSYNIGAPVGELQSVSIEGQANGKQLVRGTIAFSKLSTVSTQGDGYSLGAVAANNSLYMFCGVLGSSGGFVGTTAGAGGFKLVSSTAVGNFTVNTTRITSTRFGSTEAAQIYTVEGPITDTAFRVEVTQSTDPSHFLFVAVGIGKSI